MPYNETLANRLRDTLAGLTGIREMPMMGGLVFMYQDKMLAGVMKDDLLCRVDPALREVLLEKRGAKEMKLGKKNMRGFVAVDETGLTTRKDFDYWIGLCLDFHPRSKRAAK